MPDDLTTAERSLRLMELVGVAGAGKTSLSRALTQYNGRFVEGADLEVRRFGHMPYFLMNAILLLPKLLHRSPNGRGLTREEIKMMVYLHGWHQVLRRKSSSARVVVLDQGPVFKLTWLRDYGPGNLQSRGLEVWWEDMLRRWATRLDLLIWLDAPDETLLNRIRSRPYWHEVKDMSEQDGLRFLARHRRSYEEVISKLAIVGGPRVFRFNSSQKSVSEILARALHFLDQ